MALSKETNILKEDLSKEDTEDVDILSFNQTLLGIKQIKRSTGKIHQHVIQHQDAVNILSSLHSTDDDSSKMNICCRLKNTKKYGLAHITDNLPVSANVKANRKPEMCHFDVCFIVEDSPVTVVSVVSDGNIGDQDAKRYNRSLARGVIDSVRGFTTENFTVVHGLMTVSQTADDRSFAGALEHIKKQSSRLCVPDALKMTLKKCENLILAFLSSVAITTSLVSTESNANTLCFLTCDQFIILTENIDKGEVTVKMAPFSGGKVLMREVARRLERSGPTLLVMESEEQIQVARKQSTCSFMMTIDEWRSDVAKKEPPNGLTNMVTNCPDCPPPPGIPGRSWTFLPGELQDMEETPSKMVVEHQKTASEQTSNKPPVAVSEKRLVETVSQLRNELATKNMENSELKEEIERLKQTEAELSRMLDSPLSPISTLPPTLRTLDSGYGSVASFGSLLSRSKSDISGSRVATGGQERAMTLLKKMKRTLTLGRSMKDEPPSSYVISEEHRNVLTGNKTRNHLSLKYLSIEDTEDVDILSFNQNLLGIKQIKRSIREIHQHVIQHQDAVNILSSLHSTIDDSSKMNICCRLKNTKKYGLAHITDNLSVSANVKANRKPEMCHFDVCLIVEDSPVTVVSVVSDGNIGDQDAKRYNRSLARGVIDSVRGFTTENFTVVHGLMTVSQTADDRSFAGALEHIKKQSSRLCVPDALKMTLKKCENLILAFLSSVAITTSLMSTEGSLWSLTVDQFIILTENIDQQEVIVNTKPSCGGKVLMREVARRLERSGPTLLVMESEEQIQVARKQNTCSFMMTVDQWRSDVAKKEIPHGLTNMVTNCQDCRPPSGIPGRSWTFLPGDQLQEMKERSWDTALEIQNPLTAVAQTAGRVQITVAEESLMETINQLRNEVDTMNLENRELRNEHEELKQRKELLSRMLDSASLAFGTLDSGVGSIRWRLASRWSLSRFRSDVSGSKGATLGQERAVTVLKEIKQTLTSGTANKEEVLQPNFVTEKGPHYLLTGRKKEIYLSLLCAGHKMDVKRVNTDYCQVTDNGNLINCPPLSHSEQGMWSFKAYRGTCSTLCIDPSLPFHPTNKRHPPVPQYWETETAVKVGREPNQHWAVFEIGVVMNNYQQYDVSGDLNNVSWGLRVVWCSSHTGYCAQLWDQGKRVKCVSDVMSGIPGSSYTLRYGVVVDVVRSRVGFICVDKGEVLEKMDVEIKQTTFPVFCVHPNNDEISVEIKLLSGCHIRMTKDKLKLIYSCLT